MSSTTKDIFQTLSILDLICASSNTLLGYVLRKQEKIYDTTVLSDALTRVAEKWRLIAGRIEWDKQNNTFHIRVPTGKLSKPAFKLTTSTYDESINSIPLVEANVATRPARKYFYHSSTPWNFARYASLDHPIISVHISHLNDATCIGISFPHGIFDVTGDGFFLRALNDEMAGREWTPPPVTSDNPVNSAFTALGQSPGMTGKPIPASTNFEGMWRPFSLIGALKFLGSIAHEYVFHHTTNKNVFLDKTTVESLVHAVKAQAKTHGDDKWVSTGDILLAWFLKAAMADDAGIKAITVASAISFREVLTSMDPSFKKYPYNCMTVCPMPKFSSSWLNSTSIAEVALSHRDHVEQVRTLPFVQSLAGYLNTLKRKAPIPSAHWGEPRIMISNQVMGELTAVDFGAGAQLEAFWQWSVAIQVENVILINKLNDGYVIMANMRLSRWNAVEREIKRINGGGGFASKS